MDAKKLADDLDACKLIVRDMGTFKEFTGEVAVPSWLLGHAVHLLRSKYVPQPVFANIPPLSDADLAELEKPGQIEKVPESESAKIADLKRQLGAEREHGKALDRDARRYHWLRENGEQGIYVLRNWKQGDPTPPLALAQGAELDIVIDEYLSGKRHTCEPSA